MKNLIFYLVLTCFAITGLLAAQALADKPALDIRLARVGTYSTGVFDDKGAQILSYHAPSKRLFITNASVDTIDVVGITAIGKPKLLFQIQLSGPPLSVAVHPYLDLIAVAIEGEEVTDPGTVEFFSIDGESLGEAIEVGSLPDMIVWTPNSEKLLVANEGEPSDDYTIDPVGSVSIITLDEGGAVSTVETAGFEAFNGQEEQLRERGIRIFGPNASTAQDLEPEYIAVSDDSTTAWVTLQENNAIARIDIEAAEVVDIFGLGYKDHGTEGNGLDASNKDNAINIQTWPVRGMYQPDVIATFVIDGQRYLITANEGDAREYVYEVDAFIEEARVADLTLDPEAFPDWEELQDKKNLGRLKVTTSFPAEEGPNGYTKLYSFGGRSFTIWTEYGEPVFDSGDELEQIIAETYPDFFNTTYDAHEFDDRSDDKGPEPEHVVIGKIGESTIAFIGIERMGGIMAYDVSNPANPRFLDYVNNRNFKVEPEIEDGVTNPKVRDLGTEGLIFIPADKSPMDQSLVVASNEISGTTTIYIVVTRGIGS